MSSALSNERSWSDARVLVTGGGGFIGGHLVGALLERGAEVTCLVCEQDSRATLWRSGDAKRVRLIDGRLECFDTVKAAVLSGEVNTVFHLGAQTLVGVAHRHPLGTFESNIRGTYHVLEACRLAGSAIDSVVVASSDKAYGACADLPYTESTPLVGRFPYDVSKSCADLLAQSYAGTWAVPIAIARCGNVFGPGDLNWSRIVPGTIRSLLAGTRPVLRSDGSPLRDYLYVKDVVTAYLALARFASTTRETEPARRVFNFSPQRPLTVLEITRRIQDAVGGVELAPTIENTARCEIPAQHLDSTRARRELGWSAESDLDCALTETVAWYRDVLRDVLRDEGRPLVCATPAGEPNVP